jgi:cytochrome c oxidase subunit 3
MEIPFTIKTRYDTGVYNAKLGVWLFLASEVMLFGGLFSAYIFLRLGASDWPGLIGKVFYDKPSDILNVPLATINTFVLIASSVTMVMS